jgi:hypothetical protein
LSDLTRFLEKVDVRDDGCWIWTANRNWKGYGQFSYQGRKVRAHRFAYEQFRTSIPADMTIDHLCRVRHCVNPAHLEVVTMEENIRRGSHGNAAACARGHDLTGDDAYVDYRGRRVCRPCRRLRKRGYREQRRLSAA